MLTIERHVEIINILKKNKSAKVADLAKKLFIGEATIRRDLEILQGQGLIKRSYGGAVWLEGISQEIPLYVREGEQRETKDLIGSKAALLVNEGNTIIMDSSSTTYSMVKHLKNIENLTVITNGAKTAISLGEDLHFNVYSTGGKLRENSLSYIGDSAKEFIENIRADILFFSCRTVSLLHGLYDSSTEEAELRRVMIKNCTKKVLLCDSSKFESNAFYRICGLEMIDCIITDKKISAKELDILTSFNIKLY